MRVIAARGGIRPLRTLNVADIYQSRDVNSLLSGSGWHMSGDRLQVTLTTQATARDGHREGALLLWPMPAEWRGDGTQEIEFLMDDWLWPTPTNSQVALGAGIVYAAAGTNQTQQNGYLMGVRDLNATQYGSISIDATGTNPGSPGVTAAGPGLYESLLWPPKHSGSAINLPFGRGIGRGGVGNADIGVMQVIVGSTTGYNSGYTPYMAVCALAIGTSAGNQRTFGSRIRPRVIDLLDAGSV